MFRRNDPRFRRTLNQLSQNIESANETAQAGLFDFNQRYLAPCLSSVVECLNSCTEPCLGSREEQLRRQRRRTRVGAESSFDFYDDWADEEESGGLLGLSNNDELDRLLAGTGAASRHRRRVDEQPGRNRAMSYGTRRDQRARRKSQVVGDDGTDPTIIPQSSVLGFLERFKLGGKGLKYQPSAANLQDHPGDYERRGAEGEVLINDDEHDEAVVASRHKRNRSDTGTSGHTSDSLSSRGDIFPSEDELDDAQLMDDEFAVALARRDTGMETNEASSGKTRSSKRPSVAQQSTRSVSSKSTKEGLRKVFSADALTEEGAEELPTLSDLKKEEELVQREEEANIARKREAARRTAIKRGFSTDALASSATKRGASHEGSTFATELQSPAPIAGDEAFPHFDADAQPVVSEPTTPSAHPNSARTKDNLFVPAKLPNFSQGPD